MTSFSSAVTRISEWVRPAGKDGIETADDDEEEEVGIVVTAVDGFKATGGTKLDCGASISACPFAARLTRA